MLNQASRSTWLRILNEMNVMHFKNLNIYIYIYIDMSKRKRHNKNRLQPKTYTAFLLPWYQFSHISPAIVRPLPTPAPSPIKNPALATLGSTLGSRWRCLCHGNQLYHSVRADKVLINLKFSNNSNLTSIDQCLNLQTWQSIGYFQFIPDFKLISRFRWLYSRQGRCLYDRIWMRRSNRQFWRTLHS